jgi:aminoglycoside 3-N-acetyltransferase
MLRNIRRKTSRHIHRLLHPVSAQETRRAVDEVTGGGAEILLVHSSLSSLGRFTSGPEDIILSLCEFSGTLGFPTHTYYYPLDFSAEAPLFDSIRSPSQNGFLTELFRSRTNVVRSIHSTHSLAMTGPLAQTLAENHCLSETPAGRGTPYHRLVQKQASVMMWGVNFHSYTLFHTAEDDANSPFAYEPGILDKLRVLDENGQVRECLSRRQTRDPRRFAAVGEMLERMGLVNRVAIGAGYLLFVRDVSKVHDFLVERLVKTPNLLFENCTESLVD